MRIREIMSPQVVTARHCDTVYRAAELMAEYDIGFLPVIEDGKVCGVVSDRDLVLRALSLGLNPRTTHLAAIMTRTLACARAEADSSEAFQIMEVCQTRRLLALDDENRLVGVVSIGDLAVREQANGNCGRALERLSEPPHDIPAHDYLLTEDRPLAPIQEEEPVIEDAPQRKQTVAAD